MRSQSQLAACICCSAKIAFKVDLDMFRKISNMAQGPQTMSLSPRSNKAASTPTQSLGDSHAVSKRLQSELKSLMMQPAPGVSAFPDGDSFFFWLGTIQGVQGTVYQGHTYKLSLRFFSGNHERHPSILSCLKVCQSIDWCLQRDLGPMTVVYGWSLCHVSSLCQGKLYQ